MNAEFFLALDLLEKEKGISKEYMLTKVEAALLGAYKKESDGNTNIRVNLDPESQSVHVYKQVTVVETPENTETQISLEEAKKISKKSKIDDILEIELKPKNFRRLSATAAKQVIIQGIREAERMNLIKEYESKREELVTALVVKTDRMTGDVMVDTGTSVAVLKRQEQIPGEDFRVGDRVKVFVSEVKHEAKGPVVIISRVHPGLVKRIFELEVPEIQDGTVLIKSVAREPGLRTKIAVESRDENVDPVGACIGNRGARINSVVDELCGEKIDIVKFSEVPEDYVAAALSPAEVISVTMEDKRACRVRVAPEQLSLAIGREGQNARLAAKLTGIKIDIKAS